jgi:quercetin dioxygenase-like cupin family protein
MRTTVFKLESGEVATKVQDEPAWQGFEEYDGKPLEGVRVQDLLEPPGVLIQLVEIRAGGSFAMHSSPDVAFCQVVRGRGKLGAAGRARARLQGAGALRLPAGDAP